MHHLYRHLAACDLAVVQGGLTTTMELTAQPTTVPLLPAAPPLRAELSTCATASSATARGGAWTSTTATPDVIAQAIAEEIGADVDYRRSRPTARQRAAALIAELV